jgi:diguanylate cyclase (GGDEF)-like protein
MQGDRGPDPRLLIVEITEQDLATQDQWPTTDAVLAQVLRQLQAHEPSVVGLDLYRNLKHPPGTPDLQAQLQKPNVVAIRYLGDQGVNQIPPPPSMDAEQIGFNDFVKDPDGVVRRQFAFAALGEERLYSLSLRLALQYLADPKLADPARGGQTSERSDFRVEGESLRLGAKSLRSLNSDSGGYRTIDASGYQYLLRYRSEEKAAASLTLTQVLNGDFDPALVKGKIVLIGATAPSLKDTKQTPYGAGQREEFWVPGVVIHAQMVSQLLDVVLDGRSLLTHWPTAAELLWVWAWSLVGGLMAWRLKHPLSLGIASAIGLGCISGLGLLLFSQAIWVPVGFPMVAFFGTSVAMIAYQGFYAVLRDPLTGLPNRELFKRLVARSLQQQSARRPFQKAAAVSNSSADNNAATAIPEIHSLSVLFVDLDRFQAINETFGRRSGDLFLQAIAHKLQRHKLSGRHKIARLDQDAFGVLIEQVSHSQEAIDFADRLQAELSQPITLEGQSISTTASVGISLAQIGYRYDPEQLIQDAHTATYRAKSLGKARYEVFSNGLRSEAAQRFQTETDLKQALTRQELYLNYQPLVDLTTGAIAGFEALVRWQHPERGIVSPGEFIPVAEETGLIIPMGQWIFAEACRQAQVWRQQFPRVGCDPLIMSINLSAQQFNQPDLVEQICATLKATETQGNTIKIELTESMVMDDVEATIPLLLRLKALKIKLGLDDFGTGYSSLSYLHRFPLDTLKIDRSFVMQMEEASENREIVKTIIALGHNLGMDIIAEGVETEAQGKLLQQFACEYGQGYFFARPLGAEAATELLAQNRVWAFLLAA